MTKIPTLVKIDEFRGKLSGRDLKIVEEWKKSVEEKKKKLETQREEFRELGGDY